MIRNLFFNKTVRTFLLIALLSMSACQPKPSRVEQMRMDKAHRDSIAYVQAQQTMHYSDSLLQTLLPQVDPLLKSFRYEKNEKVEDHGQYVHRLLQTNSNTQRNFIQAYVSDDRRITIKSYCYGNNAIQHHHLKVSAGEVYMEREGSLHVFEVEGVHEILTIEQEDALALLRFITEHMDERIMVTAYGRSRITYYLQTNEKQALAQTYHLAMLMQDIDQLERAIKVASMQISKYENKHTQCK